MENFSHLHCHTEYALIDGLCHIKPLFAAARERGIDTLAVTDEMNLFAAIKVYKAAMAASVKPIFGADIWVDGPDAPFKLTALCENQAGYHRLTILISRAYQEGRRPDELPLIDPSWLAEDLSGIILIAGEQSDVGRAITHNRLEDAVLLSNAWQALVGDRHFFLSLSRIGHSKAYERSLLAFASEHACPLVATNAVCFIDSDDFVPHECRVAIHDGYTLDDAKRPKRYTDQQYLRSASEMAELFADLPDVLTNTRHVALRCNVHFELDKPCLPTFPIPEGMTEEAYFRQVSQEGLEKRLTTITAGADDPDKARAVYQDRLTLELDVIINMGFPGYFLIVADFIHWAKTHDVPVGPGRGSGAGSLVAFALEITDIDPIPYDLLFERFLNPERVSMPDFDIDFCMDGRDRVIEYVAEKYGRQSVSQIITYGSMAAKAVIRDVGRVMSHSYGFVDSIAKLVPFDVGMTLTKALEVEEMLKKRYDTEDDVRALIDMGLKLEGTVRNVGKHAGGVVISPTLLTDFCPIYCEAGSQQLVTQFDKDDVEAAGLVKFDFLGLRNLTIIADAVKVINAAKKETKEPEFAISEIPLNDPKAFKLLKSCQTTAVFQLESRGMKDLIRRLQPDDFEEIIALVALFRPGPLQSGMVDDFINRKHGRASVEFPHPLTEAILKPTYGIILYQEQVMMISQVLAGFTLGAADMLRRAMGKKKPEEMAKQRDIFLQGAEEQKIPAETASSIFDLMEKFAGYGFNKSHSAAYAMLSYQTAYLKAHFPAEFMAAVLSSDMDSTDKVVAFIEDSKQIGLNILPPDINISATKFTVEDDAIRYGLGAVKGAGESALEIIFTERATNGPYLDLFDFCERVDAKKVNRRVMEALIFSGAMDGLGPSRESLSLTMVRAQKSAEQHNRNQANGQVDLFTTESVGRAVDFIHPERTDALQTMLREKAVLGTFISAHPFDMIQDELAKMPLTSIGALNPSRKNAPAKIAGIITGERRLRTKRGQLMIILTIEDAENKIEITLFEEAFEQFAPLLKGDRILVFEVNVSEDRFSGGLRLSLRDLMTFESARNRFSKGLHIALSDSSSLDDLQALKQTLKQYEGHGCPVSFSYQSAAGEVRLACGENGLNVSVSDRCLADLRRLFHDGVEVVY